MKLNKIIAAVIIFIGIIIALLILSRNESNVPAPTANQEPTSQKTPIWETKIDDQGEVIVTVTPPNFAGNDAVWKFKIVLDTHSVELSNDLTKDAALLTNAGEEYQPLGWEGDPPGGHHRQGQLLFAPIQSPRSSITLKLKNIGAVPVRQFQWGLDLKN